MRKLLLLSIFICIHFLVMAQSSNVKFGQSRIQYKTFDWKYIDSTHFRAFFYRHGENLAQYVLNKAEAELGEIVQRMGGNLPRKLNLIIYTSYSDYLQTNIGRQNDIQINEADGGLVNVAGDNVAVYFTGDHLDLQGQIKNGVAQVIKDNMLFGDNIKEVVKNAIKMNLPEWYTAGYVKYISENWTAHDQGNMQSILQKDSTKKFNYLVQKNPELFGHSFFHFIAVKYGANNISNLIYLTRYRNSLSSAIESVFNIKEKDFYELWKNFYLQIPEHIDEDKNFYGREKLKNLKISAIAEDRYIRISPNEKDLAYIEKKDGLWTVYYGNIKAKTAKALLSGGYRNINEIKDPDYPMLAWSPNGNYLAILTRKINATQLLLFNAKTRSRKIKNISSYKIERITGMSFAENDFSFIFSGIKKGQSDLFHYTIAGNRLENITNDIFDDKEPTFYNSGERIGVVFLSNRNNPNFGDALQQSSTRLNPYFDIYFYSIANKQQLELLYSNEKNNISQPIPYNIHDLSFMVEENGILQRKILDLKKLKEGDSTALRNAVYLPYNISEHYYYPSTNKIIEVLKRKGGYEVYSTNIESMSRYEEEHPESIIPDSNKTGTKVITPQIDHPKYVSQYEDTDSNSSLTNIFTNKANNAISYSNSGAEQDLLLQKAKKYRTTFYPDFIVSALDNSLLFTRYQPYTGNGFVFPPLSGFFTTSFTDILEDFNIAGGFRTDISFNNKSYFVQFENYKRRNDWKVVFYRNVNSSVLEAYQAPKPYVSPGTFKYKQITEYVEGTIIHPFDPVKNLQFHQALRVDKDRYLAQDEYSLHFPNKENVWSFSSLEFVYDNSVHPLINIYKGSRFRVFAEFQKQLTDKKTSFYHFGGDFRYYKSIYKNSIFASRFATGMSGGKAKMLYYMGGVDNPILNLPAMGVSVDESQNYVYQTLATPLRGYKSQARNGNSYFLFNEEIRVPIANTFFNRTVKSSFLRNFQVVGFTDIGLTWNAVFPNSDKMSSNIFASNSFTTISVQQSNFCMGYGAGIRTKIMGYFMRLDAAWNILGAKKPMLHLSMSTDF